MEPWDYCRLWVTSIEEGELGYRNACIKALEDALFGVYQPSTIARTWGDRFQNRPEAVPKMLRAAHLLNLTEGYLEDHQRNIAEAAQSAQTILYSLRGMRQ